MFVCVYVLLCVSMYMCSCVFVCVYALLCVIMYMCSCEFVCVYVLLCVSMYIFSCEFVVSVCCCVLARICVTVCLFVPFQWSFVNNGNIQPETCQCGLEMFVYDRSVVNSWCLALWNANQNFDGLMNSILESNHCCFMLNCNFLSIYVV